MSNLDNMINKILEDGKKEAAKIKEEARQNNEELVESRILEANTQKEAIIKEANKEAVMLKSRLESEVKLKIRDEKLVAKRQVLDKTFELAKDSLRDIGEDKYLGFLKRNLDEITLKGSEKIVAPEKFKDAIEKSGLNVSVSSEESVESGFLLKDGNIVINYSFESLVDFMREDLEGEVAKALFQEEE